MTIFYILVVTVVVIALIRIRYAPDRPRRRTKAPNTTVSRRVKSSGTIESGSWWFSGEGGGSHGAGDGFDGGNSDGGCGSSSDF